MNVEFFEGDDGETYTFIFPNGLKFNISDYYWNDDGKYIESLGNIISGIDESKYTTRLEDNLLLIIKLINNKIIFSLITDFMYNNPDNRYIKPIIEISISYDNCIDSIKKFHNTIIKYIENHS
jgi:hypothetical protein